MPSSCTEEPRLADFQAFYAEHAAFVAQVVRRCGVPAGGVEDAVQDVFVTAYRRWTSYDTQRQARAWLYGIARRTASNTRRGLIRGARKHVALSEVEGVNPTARLESWLELERFAARLNDDERELFVSSELEGRTGPELADAFALNVNTVYSRLRLLRRRRDDVLHAGEGEPAPDSRRWTAALVAWFHLPTWSAKLGAIAGSVASWPGLVAVTVPAFGLGLLTGVAVDVGRDSSPVEVAAVDEPLPRDRPEGSSREGVAPVARPQSASIPVSPEVASPPTLRRASVEPDPPGPSLATSIAAWNDQLREAARALEAGQPERTLAVCSELAAEVEGGPLDPPRLALQIEALCALDRVPEARERARHLMNAYPGSTVLERVERSCAGTTCDASGRPSTCHGRR